MARAPSAVPTWRRLLVGSDPIRRAIYIAGMVPAVWYFYLGVMDQLGADPQKTLERLLGLWALRFLIAGLAITPLRRLGGPNLVGNVAASPQQLLPQLRLDRGRHGLTMTAPGHTQAMGLPRVMV